MIRSLPYKKEHLLSRKCSMQIQYIMDIVIMVGTWDFWPNYHYIQYISISKLSVYPNYQYIQYISISNIHYIQYISISNISLYPIYHYIQCISLNSLSLHIFLEVLPNFLSNSTCNNIYIVRYELWGPKKVKNQIFLYNLCTNYHYIQ